MRVIAGWRGPDKPAASTNSMSRFETEVLTIPENLEGLTRLNDRWVQQGMARTPRRRVILDLDSSESPVHGEQEGAAYNGYFGCVCYHPLFGFNQFGECEGAKIRPGNVHSAHEWREVLEPIVARHELAWVRRYFRGDAAFARPEIYEYLEERRFLYAIQLPSNDVLEREIRHLMRRSLGGLPGSSSSGITTSSVRRGAGTVPGGWWPRWSGTEGSCFPGRASSSPTCQPGLKGWLISTTGGGQWSSGSKRASMR